MSSPTLGLVCAAAGGIEQVRERLIEPMLADGWSIAVTLTPTAATWLAATDEIAKIEAATGFPSEALPACPTKRARTRQSTATPRFPQQRIW